ncbi:unnamed protein product [Zymoseptoria tritici ST99CH_3D7]|uniref:Uncharacterized protein n=1 Tax=Zymoseptoria tritici (strain ST99CH_3D7) TaxID=1276538 RepID=A0A1X7S3D7_ZYMT9|nr:unnamed protein product [Zymoseptoria tritici ST99CH_3D7]
MIRPGEKTGRETFPSAHFRPETAPLVVGSPDVGEKAKAPSSVGRDLLWKKRVRSTALDGCSELSGTSLSIRFPLLSDFLSNPSHSSIPPFLSDRELNTTPSLSLQIHTPS